MFSLVIQDCRSGLVCSENNVEAIGIFNMSAICRSSQVNVGGEPYHHWKVGKRTRAGYFSGVDYDLAAITITGWLGLCHLGEE
jgi:hypothetical protein